MVSFTSILTPSISLEGVVSSPVVATWDMLLLRVGMLEEWEEVQLRQGDWVGEVI